MATFSSDLVFDGRLGWAYVESDRPCPINVYGESKAESERQVLDRHPGALVVRTSAFFGPWDTYNFAWAAIRALLEGRSFEAAADQWVSPTYVPDLANWTLDLLIDGVTGIRHLANRCEITWADFAEHLAEKMSLDPGLVHRRSHAELRQLAQRPERSTLASEKGNPMPSLEDAVERYLNEISVRNPLTVRKAINAMAL